MPAMLALLPLAALLATGAPRPPACDTSAGTPLPLAEASGRRVGTLAFEAEPPAGVPGPLVRLLHVRTREAVLRRALLLAAGDTLDTLRVAESLRRLRALGVLDDERIEARSCTDGALELRVVTRDAWSTRPVVRYRGSAAQLGVDEGNALGRGIGLRMVLRDDGGRLGAGVSTLVPGLPYAGAVAEAGASQYADGAAWFAAVRPRSWWLTERWIVDGAVAGDEREPRALGGARLERTSASLLAGPRLGDDAGGRSWLLFGVETNAAALRAGTTEALIGPAAVRRDYAGVAASVLHVGARAATVPWLLGGDRDTDVPLGLEGDLLAGLGRDRARGGAARHLDAWMGETQRVGADALVVGDLWASAFAGDHRQTSSTVRGSLQLLRAAPRGTWRARLAGERLVAPDPDVRALAMLDPLATVLPAPARLSEGGALASIERDVALHAVGRSSRLDGALFAAASYRWDPSGDGAPVALAAVGVGLRLAPSRSPRSTLRLDFGMPLAHTAGAPARPFIAFSIDAWPFAARERDGRRRP